MSRISSWRNTATGRQARSISSSRILSCASSISASATMPEIAESLASIPIPQEFFRDLLPRVRDLSELKVTLFVFQLGAAAGKPGVPLSVLSDPRVVKAVVGTESPEPLEERFRRIVNRA